MKSYIWQHNDWQGHPAPKFSWQMESLHPLIERLQHLLSDFLPPEAETIPNAQMQVHIDTLVQSAIRSSEIEGEILDARSVRSSVCLLYTSPSPRDQRGSRMPSSA